MTGLLLLALVTPAVFMLLLVGMARAEKWVDSPDRTEFLPSTPELAPAVAIAEVH